MITMTRDELVKKLADEEFDRVTHADIYQMLTNGCPGYNNMSDDELREAHLGFFDEDVVIN